MSHPGLGLYSRLYLFVTRMMNPFPPADDGGRQPSGDSCRVVSGRLLRVIRDRAFLPDQVSQARPLAASRRCCATLIPTNARRQRKWSIPRRITVAEVRRLTDIRPSMFWDWWSGTRRPHLGVTDGHRNGASISSARALSRSSVIRSAVASAAWMFPALACARASISSASCST